MKGFLKSSITSSLLTFAIALSFANPLLAQEEKALANSYTLAEIATHNSAASCWLIINNSVYDLTQYLGDHPAGAKRILRYCGSDATSAFDNVGHSDQAMADREAFNIGTVAP